MVKEIRKKKGGGGADKYYKGWTDILERKAIDNFPDLVKSK